MNDCIFDSEGRHVARIRDGELFDEQGLPLGTVRHNNVYDRNGKFIFHLRPVEGSESAGDMTAEALWKLFHPK